MNEAARQLITLIQPPLRISRDFIDYPYHSDLAVIQAATLLSNRDFSVEVVSAFSLPDSGLHPLDENWVLMGSRIDAVEATIEPSGVFLVHYTPFHRPPVREPVLYELLERLRLAHPDTPIVLADLYQSGEHYIEADPVAIASAYPQADLILKYQAEAVLEAECRRLLDEGRPQGPRFVDGPELKKLDMLPIPDWGLVSLTNRDLFIGRVVEHLGRGSWAFPLDGRTLPVITSRGCPHRCGHCSSNPGIDASARKVQARHSPQHVKDLIDALVLKYGATRVMILDEMVNVDERHFTALVDALAVHGVQYDFPNGMRADRVKKHHLEAMAGKITTLSVSAESGVQRIIDAVVDKKLKLPTIDRTVAGAASLGIRTLVHFIVGMPGESRMDVRETLDYAMNLFERYGAWPAVQYATPLPGTRLATDTEVLNGKTLPVIDDYGPLFQHHPVIFGQDFGPEELKRLKGSFDERLQRLKSGRTVVLQPTHRSNDALERGNQQPEHPLESSYEEQCAVLASAYRLGARRVEFTGAEPTLCAHLIELIGQSRRLGYERIMVRTNGRMAYYMRYAKALMNSGLSEVCFSLHGANAMSHGAVVGVQEAFEQSLRGIANCQAHQPEHVTVSLMLQVTESNYPELPAFIELAKKLGIELIHVIFPALVVDEPDEYEVFSQDGASRLKSVLDAGGSSIELRVYNPPDSLLSGYESFIEFGRNRNLHWLDRQHTDPINPMV